MVSKVVQEKIVKYSIDAEDLNSGIKKAATQVKSFESSLNKVNSKSIDGLSKSTDGFLGKIKNLGASIKDSFSHSKTVERLSSAVDKFTGRTGKGISDIKSGVDSLGNSTNKVGDSFSNASNKSSSSMGEITSSVSRTTNSMGQLYDATDNIQNKFSILEGAAAVALGNIASNAINTATQMVNKWTFKPIMEGFSEYERELDSTRILTSALGKEEEGHITEVMRDMENYAKTTKYSSQQMNSSLAQFVNAGIDINTADVALKGWGNLAASAGASNAQFASSLNFGLQQSLAKGYMDRMNWSSINTANMDTAKFKEVLLKYGKQLGTVDDKMVETYGGTQGMFLDAMSEEKWLTNDVFMKALREYAEDPSLVEIASNIYTFREALESLEENVSDSWSKMWVELLGKGDDARAIWTPFTNEMAKIVTYIPNQATKIAQVFNLLGGRKAVIDGVVSTFNNLKNVINWISKGVTDIFPLAGVEKYKKELGGVNGVYALIGEKIIELSKRLKEWMTPNWPDKTKKSFTEIGRLIGNIAKLLGGLIGLSIRVGEVLIPDNLIQLGIILTGTIAKAINLLIEKIFGIENAVGNSKIGDYFNKILNGIRSIQNAAIEKIISLLESANLGLDLLDVKIDRVTDSVKSFYKAFDNKYKIHERVNRSLEQFGKLLDKSGIIDFFFGKAVSADEKTSPAAIGAKLAESWSDIGKISSPIDDVKDKLSKAKDALILFKKGLEGTATQSELASSKLAKVGDFISTIYGKFDFSSLKDFVNDPSDILENLKKLGGAFKDFVSNLDFSSKANLVKSVLSNIGDWFKQAANKVADSYDDMSNVFKKISHFFEVWTSAMNESTLVKLGTITLFAQMIKNLRGGGSILSAIANPFKTIVDKFKGIKGDSINVLKSLNGVLKSYQKQIKAKALIDIGKAMLEFAGALLMISLIPTNKLLPAVMTLASVATIMVGAYTTIMYAKNKFGGSKGPGGMLETLTLELGIDDIAKSMKRMSNAMMVASIASSVLMIVKSFETVAKMDWDEIGKGLLAVGGIMTELSVATWITGNSNAKVGTGVTILAIAKAVDTAIDTITKLANLTSSDNENGLTKESFNKARNNIGLIAGVLVAAVGLSTGNYGPLQLGKNADFGFAATLLSLTQGIRDITSVIIEIASTDIASFSKANKVIDNIGWIIGRTMMMMGSSVTFGHETSALKGKGGSSFTGAKASTGNTTWSKAATVKVLLDGMASLAEKVMELTKYDADELGKGVLVIDALGLVIGLVMGSIGLSASGVLGGKAFNVATGSGFNLSTVGTVATLIGGLVILAGMTMMLTKYDGKALLKGVAVIAGLALIITGMVAITSYAQALSSAVSNGAESALNTGQLLIMVGGLILLAGSVIEISKHDSEKIKMATKTIYTLGLTIAGLAGVAAILSYANAGSLPGAIATTAQLVVIIGGLYLLSEEVIKLAKLDPAGLQQAKSVLITIAMVVGLLLAETVGGGALVGLLGTNPLVFIGIGETIFALMAVTNALTSVSDAVVKMASVGNPAALAMASSALNIICKVIASLLAVTAISGGIVGAIGTVLPGVLVGYAESIADVVKIADAISKVAMAMVPLATMSPTEMATALTALIAIENALEYMMNMVGKQSLWSIPQSIFGVYDKVKTISESVFTMSKAFIKLSALSPDEAANASKNVTKVTTAINEAVDNLQDTKFIGNKYGSAKKNAERAASVAKLLLTMFKALSPLSVFGNAGFSWDSIKSGATQLTSTVNHILTELNNLAVSNVESIQEKVTTYKDLIKQYKSLFALTAELNLSPTNQNGETGSTQGTLGGGLASAINAQLDSGIATLNGRKPEVAAATKGTIIGPVQETATELSTITPSIGSNSIGGFATGLQSMDPKVRSVMSVIAKSVTGGASEADLAKVANTQGATYSNGILKYKGKSYDVAKALGLGVEGGALSMNSRIGNAGSKGGDTYSNSVKGKTGSARGSGSSVASAAADGMNSQSAKNKASSAGSTIGQVFGDAIFGMKNYVGRKVSSIVAWAKSFFPNSPAKRGPLSGLGWVKMKRSGGALIKEWASGMVTAKDNVTEAASSVVGSAQDYLSNYNPVITPVVELSPATVRNLDALNAINGLGSSGRLKVGVEYNMLNPNTAQQSKYTIDTVVDGMNKLNNRLYELQDKTDLQSKIIANGQIIVPEIDGYKVNKALAPGMVEAQRKHENKMRKVNGGLPIT